MAKLARALLLALPVVGLAELGLHFWFAKRPPTFEEWAQVRDDIGTFPPSAPVVVAPRWAEPLARQALGDERMPLAHVARPDTSRFERAVEVSILGQRAPEPRGVGGEIEARARKVRLSAAGEPALSPCDHGLRGTRAPARRGGLPERAA